MLVAGTPACVSACGLACLFSLVAVSDHAVLCWCVTGEGSLQ